MRPRRGLFRPGPLPAAVLAAVLAGCSGGGATGAGPAHQAIHAAAQPDGCRLPISQEPARMPGSRVVLGTIDVPPDFLPQAPVAIRNGPWRYWAKWGLQIRAGNVAVVISVPPAWQHRAAITWGQNTGIVSTLRLPGCALVKGTWNAYAGGFYLRSPTACVPLIFRAGGRSTTVRFGVGRRCG